MKKDENYHLSAILYNERIAGCAEELAEEVLNPVVQKWCRAVANQHRFHENRHRAALKKLRKRTAEAEKEQQHG